MDTERISEPVISPALQEKPNGWGVSWTGRYYLTEDSTFIELSDGGITGAENGFAYTRLKFEAEAKSDGAEIKTTKSTLIKKFKKLYGEAK